VKPPLQERFQIYVVGPNQDSRLTTVAAGAVIEEVTLQLDSDAPFYLRGRALRHAYTSALTQGNLQGVKSRFAGPDRNYKQQDFLLESLSMVYYGQGGNPKPIAPQVLYPANSVLQFDVSNTGANSISNLTFYFIGVKLFPLGSVVGYTYPKRIDRTQTFAYPIPVTALGVSEVRQNQIFTCKQDADFVIRAMQGPVISSSAGRTRAEIAIVLKDWDKKPYMNDAVHFDILGGNGATPANIPVGPTPSYVQPFGTGPGQPGLFYPEIYLPKNHQILYDVYRTDGSGGSNQAEDFTFNLIGAKVFEGA